MRLLVFITALVLLTTPLQAQSLKKMRGEVRQLSLPEQSVNDRDVDEDEFDGYSPQQDRYDAAGGPCEDEQSAFGRFAGDVLVLGLLSPFIVPRAALKDEGMDASFLPHPYDGDRGSMTYNEECPGIHNSLVVLQSDFGTDFDSLSPGHARITAEHVSRFGVDSEIFYRHEDITSGYDDIWHGDTNLIYRFAQNEQWQFRAGAGVNWFNDSNGLEAGFNTTYGAEWFPKDPWLISSSLDLGRLGGSSLIHFRNTIGVTRNSWGLFTGHDYFRLGSLRLNSWINGIEYRF